MWCSSQLFCQNFGTNKLFFLYAHISALPAFQQSQTFLLQMPSYRVLHICRQGVQKTFFFLSLKRIFLTTLLNVVEYLSSGSFIDWQGYIYIFRIFWQFLHDYSNCNCLPWVIWKQAISFFSVHRYLHDHQSNIQNLEFSNKKLQFRGVNIVLSFLPFPSLCLFQQQFNFVCYSLMYILYWIKL